MSDRLAAPSTSAAARPTAVRAGLSLHDTHERLCEVEQRLDLLRFTVDGWAAWPLLRFEASRMLSGIEFAPLPLLPRRTRLLQAAGDVASLPRIKPARHFVKTYSTGLLEPSGDGFRDIWFDDVIMLAGSTFKLEVANHPGFAEHSRRALIKRNLSTAIMDVSAGVIARRKGSAAAERVARDIGKLMRDDLGLSAAGDDWVNRRLQRFAALKKVYAALLRLVQPLFVLVADFGAYGLVAAAKERGTVVLELQHGVNDRSHAGYSWPAYARQYRASMPVPDRLLLHGEHWKRELDASGFWGDSLHVVGSPRIDRWRRTPTSRATDTCTILLTTQGLEVEKVIAFFRDFLHQVPPQTATRVVIKLHPIYDADERPYREGLAAFGERVEIVSGDKGISTFEYLRRVNLHVSISSASHYDAIALGVPTVILGFQTQDVVLPLYRAGHALLARTPLELVTIASKCHDLRLPEEVSEYYFKSGACESILRELELPAGTANA